MSLGILRVRTEKNLNKRRSKKRLKIGIDKINNGICYKIKN